jgi:hypothetical protein
MNSITNEYLATARINDRMREASGRTSPVRRGGGVVATVVARTVALARRFRAGADTDRRPAGVLPVAES